MSTRTIIICATHGLIKAADRAAHSGCRLTEKTQKLQAKKGLIKGKRCACSKELKNTCEHSWVFQRRHKGTPYLFAIDKRAGKHIGSKADAEDLAADYWKAIKAGTFETKTEPEPTVMTLTRLFELHFEQRNASEKDDSMRAIILRTALPSLNGVRRPIGEWQVAPIMTVTPDDVETFTKVRVAEHVETQTAKIEKARARVADALRALRAKPQLSKRDQLNLTRLERDEAELGDRTVTDGTRSINRCLQLWRAVHNWGIRKKKTSATPFKIRHEDGSLGVVKLFKERRRRRRLEPGERERLIAACGPHLRALVEVALDTCCRKGELLSLQWSQVDWQRNKIFLPAEKTKSGQLREDGSGDRLIPMTQRVRAHLDMRKLDPDGKEWAGDKYVFGNAAGEPIKSIKTAWKLTSRRAGIVGLHFHDLRREGASCLKESGIPEHYVQEVLGHANIKTTSTYFAGTTDGLEEYFARFERKRGAQEKPSEKDAQEDAHVRTEQPAATTNAQVS